jgi:hypothetical protein
MFDFFAIVSILTTQLDKKRTAFMKISLKQGVNVTQTDAQYWGTFHGGIPRRLLDDLRDFSQQEDGNVAKA